MKSIKMRTALALALVVGGLTAANAAHAGWYNRYLYPPAVYAAIYGIEVPNTWSEFYQHPEDNAYYMLVATNIWGRVHVSNYTADVNTPGQAGAWIEAHARCYDSAGTRGWYYQTRTSGMTQRTQGQQVYTGCPNWSNMLYGRGWIWAP